MAFQEVKSGEPIRADQLNQFARALGNLPLGGYDTKQRLPSIYRGSIDKNPFLPFKLVAEDSKPDYPKSLRDSNDITAYLSSGSVTFCSLNGPADQYIPIIKSDNGEGEGSALDTIPSPGLSVKKDTAYGVYLGAKLVKKTLTIGNKYLQISIREWIREAPEIDEWSEDKMGATSGDGENMVTFIPLFMIRDHPTLKYEIEIVPLCESDIVLQDLPMEGGGSSSESESYSSESESSSSEEESSEIAFSYSDSSESESEESVSSLSFSVSPSTPILSIDSSKGGGGGDVEFSSTGSTVSEGSGPEGSIASSELPYGLIVLSPDSWDAPSKEVVIGELNRSIGVQILDYTKDPNSPEDVTGMTTFSVDWIVSAPDKPNGTVSFGNVPDWATIISVGRDSFRVKLEENKTGKERKAVLGVFSRLPSTGWSLVSAFPITQSSGISSSEGVSGSGSSEPTGPHLDPSNLEFAATASENDFVTNQTKAVWMKQFPWYNNWSTGNDEHRFSIQNNPDVDWVGFDRWSGAFTDVNGMLTVFVKPYYENIGGNSQIPEKPRSATFTLYYYRDLSNIPAGSLQLIVTQNGKISSGDSGSLELSSEGYYLEVYPPSLEFSSEKSFQTVSVLTNVYVINVHSIVKTADGGSWLHVAPRKNSDEEWTLDVDAEENKLGRKRVGTIEIRSYDKNMGFLFLTHITVTQSAEGESSEGGSGSVNKEISVSPSEIRYDITGELYPDQEGKIKLVTDGTYEVYYGEMSGNDWFHIEPEIPNERPFTPYTGTIEVQGVTNNEGGIPREGAVYVYARRKGQEGFEIVGIVAIIQDGVELPSESLSSVTSEEEIVIIPFQSNYEYDYLGDPKLGTPSFLQFSIAGYSYYMSKGANWIILPDDKKEFIVEEGPPLPHNISVEANDNSYSRSSVVRVFAYNKDKTKSTSIDISVNQDGKPVEPSEGSSEGSVEEERYLILEPTYFSFDKGTIGKEDITTLRIKTNANFVRSEVAPWTGPVPTYDWIVKGNEIVTDFMCQYNDTGKPREVLLRVTAEWEDGLPLTEEIYVYQYAGEGSSGGGGGGGESIAKSEGGGGDIDVSKESRSAGASSGEVSSAGVTSSPPSVSVQGKIVCDPNPILLENITQSGLDPTGFTYVTVTTEPNGTDVTDKTTISIEGETPSWLFLKLEGKRTITATAQPNKEADQRHAQVTVKATTASTTLTFKLTIIQFGSKTDTPYFPSEGYPSSGQTGGSASTEISTGPTPSEPIFSSGSGSTPPPTSVTPPDSTTPGSVTPPPSTTPPSTPASTAPSGGAGESKTAILSIDGRYRGLFCIESPETWFIDFVKIPLTNNRKSGIGYIDNLFIRACDLGTVSVITAIDANGFPARAFKDIYDDKTIIVSTIGFGKKANWVEVQIKGKRKGYSMERFPIFTEAQYRSNEAFYAQAHNGRKRRY